jgi:glycosyltransferase involved in cell wall biosynthesis
MACGVPIVASRSGGIVEIIEEGVTGLLAPPGASSVFAEAVETMVKNPRRRQEMAGRARADVKERFGLAEFAAKTMRVYESMWAGNKSPRPGTPVRLPEA